MMQPTKLQETFIPNLCNVHSVLGLVLVGELLALAMSVARFDIQHFNWLSFGLTSFVVQWVMLSSAAVMCALRPFFAGRTPLFAAAVSYLVVVALTALVSITGSVVSTQKWQVDASQILGYVIISSIVSGVFFRYFYLQYQLRKQQQAELHSRIEALQSRIRPHFLFNSMNSIASLIDIDPQKAEQLVVDLSQLFRASLNAEVLVPLAKEVDLCRRFIAIEQVRLGHRLNVQWQVDQALDGAEVPSLLIQPLLENAICHGIQPIPEGGVVRVRIEQAQKSIVVVIENPVTEQPIAAHTQNNGIALENIQHRLHAIYGHRARFTCSNERQLFRIKLTIPKTHEEK